MICSHCSLHCGHLGTDMATLGEPPFIYFCDFSWVNYLFWMMLKWLAVLCVLACAEWSFGNAGTLRVRRTKDMIFTVFLWMVLMDHFFGLWTSMDCLFRFDQCWEMLGVSFRFSKVLMLKDAEPGTTAAWETPLRWLGSRVCRPSPSHSQKANGKKIPFKQRNKI